MKPFNQIEEITLSHLNEGSKDTMETLMEIFRAEAENLGYKGDHFKPVGFRLYGVTPDGQLICNSYLSEGIDLGEFGLDDQAVKINSFMPENMKQALLKTSGLIYALYSQADLVANSCSKLWDMTPKNGEGKLPLVDDICLSFCTVIDSFSHAVEFNAGITDELRSQLQDAHITIRAQRDRIASLEAALFKKGDESHD